MRWALVLALAGGCVSLGPSPLGDECEVNIGCPLGESCRDGVCILPASPALAIGAQILPPSTRPDLAATEITAVEILPEGHVALGFERPAVVTGRITFGTLPLSVPAHLRFSRPSRIPGAPPLTVEVDAAGGKPTGAPAFSVRLSTNLEDEAWTVTIVPDAQTVIPELGTTLAQVAPTRKTSFVLGGGGQVHVELPMVDGAGLKEITGKVTDAAQRGLEGLKVTALGRPSPGAPLEACSSIGRTQADGSYAIRVPSAWEDTFDVLVEPTSAVRAPSLRLRDVEVPDGEATKSVPIEYPSYAAPVAFDLPVYSKAPAGGTDDATDAEVVFTTTLLDSDTMLVTYRATGIVDVRGLARIELIPGAIDANRDYAVRVIPSLNTPHGSVWSKPVAVGPEGGGVLPDLVLPRRPLLTGRVTDHLAQPVSAVTVRPSVSPRFTRTLSPEAQAQVAALRAVEVFTNEDGRFEIYLDPALVGIPATYDLELSPPAGGELPRSTWEDVSLPEGLPAVDLGDLPLPRGAVADGPVSDADGLPVSGAEIRVWLPEADEVDCAATCRVPARLLVLATSDDDGRVRLLLPAP
jgi:hypothetical protein